MNLLNVQVLHEAMGHAENKISLCTVFQHKKKNPPASTFPLVKTL